ncbi:hypothetical protein [Tenacibaculum xiamenense]|uniref:hypothetical protein n=1 Tax=Tenacibaculum xiamenense TaxID=1261553 RepID=UPI0038944639
MKALKRIEPYFFWIAMSLLLGIGYMRIVLGPNEVSDKGLGYIYHVFYDLGLLYVGSIIGAVIAILFIIVDVFYLKKKANTKLKIKRFVAIFLIAMFVAIIHYILEKKIDVI